MATADTHAFQYVIAVGDDILTIHVELIRSWSAQSGVQYSPVFGRVDVNVSHRCLGLLNYSASATRWSIDPPGMWHTAGVDDGEVEAVFITAGAGTEHRAR